MVRPGRERRIAVARGDEPADLVIRGGHVLSVFSGEVFPAGVAICDGVIAGVGDYAAGRDEFDASGCVLVPGFIDGHCHIESTKLSPAEFARAVVPRGTTTVVVDPHELANVLGVDGVRYVLDATESLPLRVLVKLPSCVPASPFESPRAPIEAPEYADLLDHPRVIGIAEMMNYPGAIAADPGLMAKMALTGFRGVDGHAPAVSGRDLCAYLVAGPGNDHECSVLAEAREKRRLGMWIMLREASMIRNLVDLLPLIGEGGTENLLFVTDDREAGTLLTEGHINSMIRTAVAHGVAAGDAVRLASLNVARCHGLDRLGAVAPGYDADICVLPDLASFEPLAVFSRGQLVARDGQSLPFVSEPAPALVRDTVHCARIDAASFRLPATGSGQVRVVELVPDQVVTRLTEAPPAVRDGEIVADPARDLVKLAVIERHHASGRVGLGLVRGFGLRRGAFASTIAHDAHNIVVAGVDDADMALCVERLVALGGGLVVAADGEVRGELALDIAGLMSSEPAEQVAAALDGLEEVLRGQGVRLATPFMYLGFLALSVIPEARLTDRGLVDVTRFSLVPLEVS